MKYTPLEKQYMEVAQEHPELLLMVENGYKYDFFGKDAEVHTEQLIARPSHVWVY